MENLKPVGAGNGGKNMFYDDLGFTQEEIQSEGLQWKQGRFYICHISLGRLLSGASQRWQCSTRFNVQQVALYTFRGGVQEFATTQLPWYATSCGTALGYKLQMFPAGKDAFSASPA
jgi:hypothetical protein